MMCDMSMMWGMGWMGVLGFLLVSLWIGVLATLIWALIRWLNKRTGAPTKQQSAPSADQQSALTILAQRYARGEIDQETFEHMREHIGATERTERAGTL